MNRQEKIAALASTYAALGVDVEKSIQVATDVLAVIFPPLDQIDRDEDFQRDYIPVPGGYEFQTKGKGSTYRIAAVDEDDHTIDSVVGWYRTTSTNKSSMRWLRRLRTSGFHILAVLWILQTQKMESR